jgi:hypothetical protein
MRRLHDRPIIMGPYVDFLVTYSENSNNSRDSRTLDATLLCTGRMNDAVQH